MKTIVTWTGMLGIVLATSVCGIGTRTAEATPPTPPTVGRSSIPEQLDAAPAAEVTETAPVEIRAEPLPTPPHRGVPLLSKIPYVSRLFKNVGVARGCKIKLNGGRECEVLGVYSFQPCESADGENRLGVDFHWVTGCQQKCEPSASQAAATCNRAACTSGKGEVAETCGVTAACGSAGPCECAGGCTAAAHVAKDAAATGCACGEKCRCGKSAPVVAGPLPWVHRAIPAVGLPSVFGGHHIAIPAHTVPGPPVPPIVAPAPIHHRGCPFQALHEQLVAARTEQARLEARLEARNELTQQLLELAAENGKLQATADLAGKIIELKDKHAEQQRELFSQVLEMKAEQMEALAELAVEKAKLEAKVELAEEKLELNSEILQSQVQLVSQQTALAAQATQIEEKLEAAKKLRAENDELKRQLAELRDKQQPYSYAAPHTATRPTVRAEEPATEK
jgi:hypothetical protein